MRNTVVAIAGLPTSGKSTLGQALSEITGLHFIDIDSLAAVCAPAPEPNPYENDEKRGRERARMTIAYRTLHAAVEASVDQGVPVIVAATYSRHTNQRLLNDAVKKFGGDLLVVLCEYDDTDEEVSKRVQARISGGYIGGCRSTDHYFDDKRRYEGIILPRRCTVEMDGGQPGIKRAVAEVFAHLE